MNGVVYVSWADNTGYANAAKAYIRLLLSNDISVNWQPMLPGGPLGYEAVKNVNVDCEALQTALADNNQYDVIIVHTVPDYYQTWINSARKNSQRIIGMTVWEHETLPSLWRNVLNQLDEVIVPCEWNYKGFRRSGVTIPIHVVSHLPHTAHVSPSSNDVIRFKNRLSDSILSSTYIFYSINFWSERKAPLLTIKAFLDAFSSEDNVALVVKTTERDVTKLRRSWRSAFRLAHPSPKVAFEKLLADYKNPPNVQLICDESLDDREIAALHNIGDCFYSLTRCEGWGLSAFDAAMLGKPVLMTSYGGQSDYLPTNYPWRVPYTLIPVNEPLWNQNYKNGDVWAEAHIDKASHLLKKIYSERSKSAKIAAQHAQQLQRVFSNKKIFGTLINSIT